MRGGRIATTADGGGSGAATCDATHAQARGAAEKVNRAGCCGPGASSSTIQPKRKRAVRYCALTQHTQHVLHSSCCPQGPLGSRVPAPFGLVSSTLAERCRKNWELTSHPCPAPCTTPPNLLANSASTTTTNHSSQSITPCHTPCAPFHRPPSPLDLGRAPPRRSRLPGSRLAGPEPALVRRGRRAPRGREARQRRHRRRGGRHRRRPR